MPQVTTHAPGPWSILDNRETNGTYWIEAQHPDGYPVSIAEVRQGCGEAEEIGSVEANYLLIAAAPDLLAALKLILPLAKGYAPEGQTAQARSTCNDWIAVAMAAVERAEPQS